MRDGTPRKALIILDCDGTLVDSEPLCGRALSMALGDFGITFDPEEYMSQYKGVALSTIQQRIAAARGISIPEGVTERYRDYVRSLFGTELRMVTEIDVAIERMTHTMCVASNGPLAKMRHALEITGLAPHFGERLFSAYEVGAWKPEPELFLACARHFGVDPAQCIVVEDSDAGLRAAQAAGMKCIYFAHHNRQPVSVTPDAIAERARELPNLIATLAADPS